MPVWKFNTLQLHALSVIHFRKKAAEELKTLATISALSGNTQHALDCYFKMVELNDIEREIEKEEFTEDAMATFDRLAEMFNKGKVNG